MKSTTALAIATVSLLTSQAAAHGHMTQPKGRTSKSFGDPQDKSACDSNKRGTVTSYTSGQEIEVVWTRNNHIGGFIRYSIAPANDVSKAAFDANAFFYTCRESDCDLKQCKHKFCGDDAGSKADSIHCKAKIKLPDYLEEGDYVLQWTWHAAGSSYGNKGWSTGNYKTCADIKLTTSGTGKKPKCPTFVGGDRVTSMEKSLSEAQRTGQCFYFDDNGIGKNLVKYSESEGFKRYMFGVPKQVQECGGGAQTSGGGNSTSPSAGSSKTPKSASKPITPSTNDNDGESGSGNKSKGAKGNDKKGSGNNGKKDDNAAQNDQDDEDPATVSASKQSGGGKKQKRN